MAMSVSMPNLPGMVPNRRGWVYRQRDGFKRSSRPGTASELRPGTASEFQSRPVSPGYDETDFSRPGTAGPGGRTAHFPEVEYYRETQQRGALRADTRPSTAGAFRMHTVDPTYRGATPLFSGTDFDPQRSIDEGAHSRPSTGKVPLYVELDRQVCRFYGHFFQDRNWEKDGPLGDPTVESRICRLVTIQVYLSDNEVQVLEPKVVNAGLPSGTFFQKARLVKNDSEPLLLEDIRVGGSIGMLGQTFYVTDADTFTRDYYRDKMGVDLQPALPRPKPIRRDMGAQYATGLGSSLPKMNKQGNGSRSTDYANTKEVLDKTSRFLKFEGRVLRFQCVEVKTPEGPFFPKLQAQADREGYDGVVASADVKRYALSFHLSTCDIDLVVQKQKGSMQGGQDEPKLVLKKSKLPTNWREARAGRTPKYFEAEDFRCGGVVDVYGKYFLLVNCDAFTRQLYDQLHTPQVDVRLISEPRKEIVQPIPQLGDGFLAIGSNEDTMATIYGMPKPGKDFDKIQRNQNRLLRCKTVMLSPNHIDSTREFMITFYLEDDTIAVFEEVKRNSGIWGGNFLKRGRYTNALPNEGTVPRYFRPGDIYLGNVISFNGNEFQILEMDNMSLDFCEHFPDEFPMMDTFKIIGTLMQQIVTRCLNIRPIFHAADMDMATKRCLLQEKFVQVLDSLALTAELNDQELLTLMRRFKNGDAYMYEEMCDLVSHVYAKHQSLSNPPPRSRKGAPEQTFEQFTVTARLRTIQWRRTLRKDQQTIDGFVTLSILEKLFKKHGLPLSAEVVDQIRRSFSADRTHAHHKGVLSDLQELGAEHLYEGLDHKVRPKEKHSNGLVDNKGLQVGLMANLEATKRRDKNFLTGSVLRRNSKVGEELQQDSVYSTEGFGGGHPARVLINFNDLCDEIYICDWL